MPRPLKFHTQKPARRKASPGGEAGSPLGLTDEVEAKNYRHEMVQRCYLRPHPVRLKPDHHSRGMTATGSHIDFGFAARSTTLQGKAFLSPGRFCVVFYRSNVPGWRARRASPLHSMTDCQPSLIRHGLRPVPPSPRGRLPSEGPSRLLRVKARLTRREAAFRRKSP